MFAKYKKSRRAHVVIGTSVLVLLICFLAVISSQWRVNPRASQTKPARLVVDAQSIKSLSWSDIANDKLFLEGKGIENLDELLSMTEASSNQAVVYVHGLLLLTDSRPHEALETFDSIELDVIPTEQLYAPYRLHDTLKPAAPNRYLLRLLTCLDQRELPPLLSARLLIRLGRLEDGLKAYLSSDPAQWTAHDAQCMERVAAHSGLQVELRRMTHAAIGGGRIRPAEQDHFMRFAFFSADQSDMKTLRGQFAASLANNPSIAPIALSSMQAIQSNRQLFLQKRYRDLLEQHRSDRPTQVTSELVLILFLSALAEEDRSLATTWGQELKRRNPHSETVRWVKNLTESAFAGS